MLLTEEQWANIQAGDPNPVNDEDWPDDEAPVATKPLQAIENNIGLETSLSASTTSAPLAPPTRKQVAVENQDPDSDDENQDEDGEWEDEDEAVDFAEATYEADDDYDYDDNEEVEDDDEIDDDEIDDDFDEDEYEDVD